MFGEYVFSVPQGFGFSYPAGAQSSLVISSFGTITVILTRIKYTNVTCESGLCIHTTSKINRLVALDVLHAHVSVQL